MIKIKTIKQKRIMIGSFGLLGIVGICTIVLAVCSLRPNNKIVEGNESIYSNVNPNFSVDFGKKEDTEVQWVRFEASSSDTNPFSGESSDDSLWSKVVSLFEESNKYGIEMSLDSVQLSANDNIDDDVMAVASVLGTSDVKTTTSLVDNVVVNSDVASGIDMEYRILDGKGVKEEIIINDLDDYYSGCTDCKVPLNEYVFNLSLDDGLVLKDEWFTIDGVSTHIYYFEDENGRYVANFLPSYAVDNSGNKTTDVSMTVEKKDDSKYQIVVTVSPEWLLDSSRAFPVRVDPSIVHDESMDFSDGFFDNIEFYGNGTKLQLTEGATSGSYVSSMIDLESEVSSVNLSWLESGVNTGDKDIPYSDLALMGSWSYNETTGSLVSNENSLCETECTLPYDFTVEAWIKLDEDKQGGTIVGAKGYTLSLVDGSPVFTVGDIVVSNDEVKVDGGAWHFVTAVKSSLKISLYVDGVLIGSIENTLGDIEISGEMIIGDFIGTIDVLRVYSRALTVGEISSDYQAGDIQFLYRTSADGSKWSEWGSVASDGALLFDGVDDYLLINDYILPSSESGDLRFTNGGSIAMWVYPELLQGDFITKGEDYKLSLTENGAIDFVVNGESVALTEDGVIESRAWNYIVIAFDKSTVTVYVNGESVLDEEVDVDMSNEFAKVKIGDHFDGAMDSFDVYTRLLLSEEVLANYEFMDGDSVYSTNGLFLGLNFNDRHGESVRNNGTCAVCTVALVNFTGVTGVDSDISSGWTSNTVIGSNVSMSSFETGGSTLAVDGSSSFRVSSTDEDTIVTDVVSRPLSSINLISLYLASDVLGNSGSVILEDRSGNKYMQQLTTSFGSVLHKSNLITGVDDLSFTIDSTVYGKENMGEGLHKDDVVIVKEVVGDVEYIAEGYVESVGLETGIVALSSWNDVSTFPESGFTEKASVFKWEEVYLQINNRLDTNLEEVSSISFVANDASEDIAGSLWVDNLECSSGYLSESNGESISFDTPVRFIQYKAIFTTLDSRISPFLSQVEISYDTEDDVTESSENLGMERLMRGGKYFDGDVVKYDSWWNKEEVKEEEIVDEEDNKDDDVVIIDGVSGTIFDNDTDVVDGSTNEVPNSTDTGTDKDEVVIYVEDSVESGTN